MERILPSDTSQESLTSPVIADGLGMETQQVLAGKGAKPVRVPAESSSASSWYSSTQPMEAGEVLQTTVAHAKILLRTLVTTEEYHSLFQPCIAAGTVYSLADAQRAVEDAQATYQSRTGLVTDPFQAVVPSTTAISLSSSVAACSKTSVKARQRLTSLSEKIAFYGNVFDVLVQHHPEYVSLAWGTFKILFTAVTNHAEAISKLSKSLAQVADLLPQHSLHLILYPTPQMQIAVARLYAHVLRFFISSLKWYKDCRTVHILKSVLQPWDLKFRGEYEAIAVESKQIRRLADAALKAEVRDTRLELAKGISRWDTIAREMSELKSENKRLSETFQLSFQTMQVSMHDWCSEIRLDVRDLRYDFASQRSTLNRVHLTQMLSLPLWSSLPASGEALAFCRSIRRRSRERVALPLPGIDRLNAWATQQARTVLLIDTFQPRVAKNLLVDLIDLTLAHGMPTIWALRYADFHAHPLTTRDVVRMLVLQTMQLGAGRLLDAPFPVTVEQLRDASTLADWVAILHRLLLAASSDRCALIMLDVDLLAHATAHERSEAHDLLDRLRLHASRDVKIVTALSNVGNSYAEELEQEDACVKLEVGSPRDWHRRQRGRRALIRARRGGRGV